MVGASSCTRDEGLSPRGPFPHFTDAAREAGITFQHDCGFDGTRYRIVETVNGGVGLLDYDGDGWIDVYFTNARKIDAGPEAPRAALYKNIGGGRFIEVSRTAGVDHSAVSLGCSVADIEGDGDPDILVTTWGPCRLYRNEGNGTFTDIAAESGLVYNSMDSGSAFLDMDEDGDLDLYVAAYVIDADPLVQPCKVRGIPGYCPPRHYAPAPHRLHENRGDGTFVDRSDSSGIRNVLEPGRGLGVIASDFNEDGHQDIYVANDMSGNFLFHGDGKGRFTELASLCGAAFGNDGADLGSMGVDAQDYDGDGRLDLCVTNYQEQIDNLYRKTEGESYEEMARQAGIATGKSPHVAWGVGLVDLDNDGWRDLFVANGHLNPFAHQMDESTTHAQPKRLFRNLGNGRFEDIATRAGDAITASRVSRGAAFGDIENDGDLDIVVINANGLPSLLRNEDRSGAAWCLVELVGAGRNRDAIGARVRVTALGRTQTGVRRSSGSYLSGNDPRLHFGLGSATEIQRIEVRWPLGRVDYFSNLPVKRLVRITEAKREARIVPGGR